MFAVSCVGDGGMYGSVV